MARNCDVCKNRLIFGQYKVTPYRMICDTCMAEIARPKRETCDHVLVPWVKSYYSDEMVQRGWCPSCKCNLIEMD